MQRGIKDLRERAARQRISCAVMRFCSKFNEKREIQMRGFQKV